MTSTRNGTGEPEDTVRAAAEVDRLLETASRNVVARKSRPSMAGGQRWSVLDPVEALHREAGHWGELCELYLQRLDVATGDAERAKLLRRTGTILCEQLDDAPQALEAFTEALIHEPEDEPTLIALEALANALSAWESVVRDVAARLDADPGGVRELALCGHLVRWTKRYLERPADAEPFLTRIRKIDPTHSAIHERLASVYREHGAFREQRDELETALLSARSNEERRLLHLALADLHEHRLSDRAAAMRHFEAALAIDPKGIDPLLGLERLFLAEERHADVIGVLEKEIEVAPTDEIRVASLLRLADIHERIFLKPERAAVVLERAIELDAEHAPVFEALERCYRAARAWKELARVVEVQARDATARPARLKKLFEAAEVFEAKLVDVDSALRVYREIVQLDSRSTEALSAIVRLCERGERSDWKGAIQARKRLAELAPTPEAKARIHVAIGETLSRHDPKQAPAQFERAVAIDPSCAAAWEALIARARAEGATDQVAEYLDQRVAHTEAPRLRSELLIALADARAALGDKTAAEAAEEDAVVIDPGNEVAARRVLPRYIAAERWLDALPLCEWLVNAAVRDGDTERAYAQRRSLTQIALALDDEGRALTAALGAYELHATSESAEDVINVCHHARTDAALLLRARATLEAITSSSLELSAAGLAKLGEVALALGSPETAGTLFRQALDADPCCAMALAALTDLAGEPAAAAEVAELTIVAAANAESREERFDLLVKAGELLAFRATQLARAGAAFEDARALVPRDHRILHMLVWIYTEIEEWAYLTEVLRSIADSETEPVRRAKGTYAMALVLRDKVGDPKRAAGAFEQVLDLDPSRLEAFERLVRVHTERRDWAALAKSYERMILRTPAEGEAEQKHALLFQLGLVYRDRVGDVPRALQAFRGALQIKPGDGTTRKALVELLLIARQMTDALDVVRAAIALRPDDAEACIDLCDVTMRLHAFDHAWRALDAASALGATLNGEAERFLHDFTAIPLSTARVALAAADRKRLFHPKLDPLLTGIFALVTRAILRSPRVRATREQAGRALGPPLQAGTPDAERILAAVRRSAQLLGFSAPDLYARKTPAAVDGIPNAPGLLVSLEACSALGDGPLAFLVTKQLAANDPELLSASIFPTLPELGALLSAAFHAVEPPRGPEVDGGPFDRIVREALAPEDRERLRALVASAKAKDARFDVASWKRFADASATRVGLLLAGSLDAARRAMNSSPQVAGAMSPRDQLQELVVLQLGDTYGELRVAIGVAVSG